MRLAGRHINRDAIFAAVDSYETIESYPDDKRIFAPFDDFATTVPLPLTSYAYRAYRDSAEAFLLVRNRRIADWAATHLTTARQLP
jgi:hypothetical protein